MSQEQLTYLAQIYNTLMTVEAKGENLLALADSLNRLEKFILTEQQKIKERKEITNAG